MPKGVTVKSIVHIVPKDKSTMCRIIYTQGIGRPSWQVRIGYDGKVKSAEKLILVERGM